MLAGIKKSSKTDSISDSLNDKILELLSSFRKIEDFLGSGK
jgi:hypothetical protein